MADTDTKEHTVHSFNGDSGNDPVFKTVGLILALLSGLFIGSSFIFKKKGLLQASKAGAIAGQGHSYLSNGLWWLGMTLMIIGELCNFVAYAFTQAILVTPLGALSVVVSAVLSSVFLNERLNMQGKIGCAQCLIGAVIILMHAPDQQSANTIQQFQHLFLHPVFLTYASVAMFLSIIVIWKIAPKYGSKNMLVYIGICSLIGSLSVVATQGLGSAIVTSIMGKNQFTHWFLYFLAGFVAVTLLTEINYLNKALNLFNTAMVTPVYYVTFTSLTMVSSAILFQGFTAPPVNIVSVVLGFLVICSGIVLLQTSKGAIVDGRGSVTYSDDHRLSMGSDGTMEPGASEIRGSFGSIRRYSLHHGRNNSMHSANPDNRRSMSLSFGGHNRRESSASSNLTTINETGSNNKSIPRGIDSTAAQIGIAIGESSFDNDAVELSNQTSLPPSKSQPSSRLSTVRFVGSPVLSSSPTEQLKSNPFIHATAPSISSTISASPPNSPPQPHLALPPPLSPLQHPINYLKSHLGQPAAPNFPEFKNTNSESYSGIHIDNKGSTGSRRSQKDVSIMEKFKFGLHPGNNDDYEELVTKRRKSNVMSKPTKPRVVTSGRIEGTIDMHGSDEDAQSSGSISPI
ncbi:hypothetical protein G9A89_004117 [Geosiphon pyriformis]|nr:hypothetical protein G9A89_004117 [Geosiphon pyriformis]